MELSEFDKLEIDQIAKLVSAVLPLLIQKSY